MQTQYTEVRQAVERMRAQGQQGMQQAFAEARTNQTRSGRIIAAIMALSVASIAGLAVLSIVLVREIKRPVARALHVADRLAEGDVETTIEIDAHDEIGQLLGSMKRMLEYQQEMAGVAGAIAAGDLTVDVRPRSERDRIGSAFRGMVEKLSATVADLRMGADTLLDRLARGLGGLAEALPGHERAGGFGRGDDLEPGADDGLDHPERGEQPADRADGRRGARWPRRAAAPWPRRCRP